MFAPAMMAVSIAATISFAPTTVSPTVKIVKIYYDSPGKDSRSNASLNAEYVVIKNVTKKTIKLGGWSISDRTGYRYVFKGSVAIKAGKIYTLRTGVGKDGSSVVFWNRGSYVWNNDSDAANLRNVSGNLVSSCSYKGSARYKVC